ncbi:MAG: hypothetical protein ABEH47_03355 [Haloferacaceae archaeon]
MVLDRLWWGSGRDPTVIVECRDCGKKMKRGDVRECPFCGSCEIARYVIDG